MDTMSSAASGGEAWDFWSFVQRASDRLSATGHSTEPAATELLLSLNRASALVTYDLESVVHRPRGRSWAAFRLLFAVWLAGPLESRRAAELSGMSRAQVSNLTGPLVDSGLLTRQPDPVDRRGVRLELTETGRTEITALFAAQHEREQRWAAALTTDEQQTLVRLLNKLITDREGFEVRGRR